MSDLERNNKDKLQFEGEKITAAAHYEQNYMHLGGRTQQLELEAAYQILRIESLTTIFHSREFKRATVKEVVADLKNRDEHQLKRF